MKFKYFHRNRDSYCNICPNNHNGFFAYCSALCQVQEKAMNPDCSKHKRYKNKEVQFRLCCVKCVLIIKLINLMTALTFYLALLCDSYIFLPEGQCFMFLQTDVVFIQARHPLWYAVGRPDSKIVHCTCGEIRSLYFLGGKIIYTKFSSLYSFQTILQIHSTWEVAAKHTCV